MVDMLSFRMILYDPLADPNRAMLDAYDHQNKASSDPHNALILASMTDRMERWNKLVLDALS